MKPNLCKTFALIAVCFSFGGFAGNAFAQTVNVLYDFVGGSLGYGPGGQLTFDSQGNLYGVAAYGGDLNNCFVGCGVAYKLTPSAGGWAESVIYQFEPGPTANPSTGLVFDSAGNLYGTSWSGCGSVFKLIPNSSGQWTMSVLHAFAGGEGGPDGCEPREEVLLDGAGNIYGTTFAGGYHQSGECLPSGCGTVFRLSPNTDGTYSETILHDFMGQQAKDGSGPRGGLVADKEGNLYGTTVLGGEGNCAGLGCGTVFELSRAPGEKLTETVLYYFQGGNDGSAPDDTLVLDATGNLYGNALQGGTNNDGTVFTLRKQSGQWKQFAMSAQDFAGINPANPLTLDNSGHVFGETDFGGPHGNGLVYRFDLATHSLNLEDGFYPSTIYGTGAGGGLILDQQGNLYGVSQMGGQFGFGLVYSIAP